MESKINLTANCPFFLWPQIQHGKNLFSRKICWTPPSRWRIPPDWDARRRTSTDRGVKCLPEMEEDDLEWVAIPTAWWFGTCFIFPYIDFESSQLTNVFQRGRSTTNQPKICDFGEFWWSSNRICCFEISNYPDKWRSIVKVATGLSIWHWI